MTNVIIAGIGQTPVGEHWDISLRELALGAVEAAIEDAGGLRPQALFVGNMNAAALSGQSHPSSQPHQKGQIIGNLINQRRSP